MRAPSWLEIKTQGYADRTPAELHVSVRVRKWHPGWWLFLLRSLFSA